MTAKELLQPRFEIINEYPLMIDKVGTILTSETDTFVYLKSSSRGEFCGNANFLEKYPHLFRKLNWWEKRKEEEMPKRIMFLQDNSILNIVGWDMQMLFGYTSLKDKEKRKGYGLETFKPEYGYVPVD